MFKKFFKAEMLTIFIFFVAIFFLGVAIPFLATKLATKNKPSSTPNAFLSAKPTAINNNNPEAGKYNFLLLGYGGAGHEGSLLTDSIIVLHADTTNHKITTISVPRDLWVPGNHKINAAGINSFSDIDPVIQNVTGLPINYYVAVDFGGFAKIIDDLGEITVTVPQTFDDPFYPITGQENNTCGLTDPQIFELKNKYQGFELERQFTCRYEHLHFDGGTSVNLDGATALKFVRSRHGDSDFGRSLRQFAVLQGIATKLISLKSLGKLDTTINTLSQIVKSDLDAGVIKSLIQILGDPAVYKVSQIQLSTTNALNEGFAADGEYTLTPKSGSFDFSSIKTYLNSQI